MDGDDTALLTCIGRGDLQLPLRPTAAGAHSRAHVQPVSDSGMSCWSEAVPTVRALFSSCQSLAQRCRGPPLARSTESLVRVFEAPFEARLRARRQNLLSARRRSWSGEGTVDEALVADLCARGLRTPWPETDALMRDDLWCRSNGEMQLQLLSFVVSSTQTSDARLEALACRDIHERLERSVRALQLAERRLAAELALQSVAAVGSAVSRRDARP